MSFGSGGKTPGQPTATPKEEDPAVQEARAEAIRRRGSQRGRRSTFLRSRMTDPQSPVLQTQPGSQETLGA